MEGSVSPGVPWLGGGKPCRAAKRLAPWCDGGAAGRLAFAIMTSCGEVTSAGEEAEAAGAAEGEAIGATGNGKDPAIGKAAAVETTGVGEAIMPELAGAPAP